MAQKSPCRAESAVLLRGAAGTSGAQKLATRPTGRPEGGATATVAAQRAEVVELGKPDVQWPDGFSVSWTCVSNKRTTPMEPSGPLLYAIGDAMFMY